MWLVFFQVLLPKLLCMVSTFYFQSFSLLTALSSRSCEFVATVTAENCARLVLGTAVLANHRLSFRRLCIHVRCSLLKSSVYFNSSSTECFLQFYTHSSECFPHFVRWIFSVCLRALHGFGAAFWAEKSVFGDFSSAVRTVLHEHHEQQLSEVENLSILQVAAK
jgi:hypothetical protein